MTSNEMFAVVYAGLFVTAFATWLLIWAVMKIGGWVAGRAETRRLPRTADMVDEYARLAVARQQREKKTLARPTDAETEIRSFLECGPRTQMARLEEARKREYAHVTAEEMVRRHDPERSAAYIAELEAALDPKPVEPERESEPVEPTPQERLAAIRKRRLSRS